MKSIGDKIKEARKIKGLTQEELAELSKMNLRTIQRIENNENSPRGKSLNLICDVLNLNVEDLLENKGIKRKTFSVTTVFNGVFLIIFNLLIISIFGYLTIDSEANLNSKFGAIILSFFIPVFIGFKTLRMNKIERMIKFGIGLLIYTIVISTKISFPSLIMTGLLPSLVILSGTLFYGNEIFRMKDNITLHNNSE